MPQYTFAVVIEKEPEDPGYFAYSPTLPGCFSDGMTIEETREHMLEAIELHVSEMIEHGEPVPQACLPLHIVGVTLAIPA